MSQSVGTVLSQALCHLGMIEPPGRVGAQLVKSRGNIVVMPRAQVMCCCGHGCPLSYVLSIDVTERRCRKELTVHQCGCGVLGCSSNIEGRGIHLLAVQQRSGIIIAKSMLPVRDRSLALIRAVCQRHEFIRHTRDVC
jgi:hypothetical protein